MSFRNTYDLEFRERAVRMYLDRLKEDGVSKRAARLEVGELLGVNESTLRNWVRVQVGEGATAAASESVDEENARLRKENAQLRRANEILRTASAFFASGGARPQVRVIVQYVHSYRDRFGVEPILTVLNQHDMGIAPSTYYAHAARDFAPTEAELTEAYLVNRLFDLWVKNRRVYGRRKLWKAALRAGYDIGRDQVERLMKIAGITGIRRGKRMRTTTPATGEVPRHADYIERHWDLPWRPDQWWIADLTYVQATAGFCYVSFVTDVFSRRILGWRVWTSMKTELVTSALNQALFTRRRTDVTFTSQGLVHHSDAGSQYLSLAFSDELHKAGIVGSIGTVGDALDNAVMESTIGLFKTEVIDHERRTWTSWRQVEAAVASWVTWYNHER
ncbi:MAG TPA: IS3 family transposase, partial [Beutenbergiaceae bacterium]|nr:IS3 family transposase [Beutenbergiaceae bacterium]